MISNDITQTGIPQSLANPLEAEIHRPWEEREQQQSEARKKWKGTAIQAVDSAVLDWDNFSKGKKIDLGFDSDPERAKRRGIIGSYLTISNDGEPIAGGELGFSMLRDKVAQERFNGRGIGDDSAFYSEIEKEAQGRKAGRDLGSQMIEEASKASIISTVEGSIRAGSFEGWLAEAKKAPGYQPGMDFAYRETWEAVQAEVADSIAEFGEPLSRVWNALEKGELGYTVSNAYYQTADEDREAFMAALGTMAAALPADTRNEFFLNLYRQTSRDVTSLVSRAGDAMNAFTVDTAVGFNPSGPAGEENSIAAQGRMERGERNFVADIRRLRDGQYDPVKRLAEGKWTSAIEGGIYSTYGALASTAVMAIPYAGLPMMYASMTGTAYEDTRFRLMDAGMTDEQASNFASEYAPLIGALQIVPERIGFLAVTRKLPALEKVLTTVSNRVTNRAMRFAATTATLGALETGTELAQDLVPALVQDVASALSEDIPDVDWQDEFKAYDEKTLSTFVAVLPLAILGAAGGLSREARAQAFAEASPVQLRALGITDEHIENIQAAAAEGPGSLNRAIDDARKNRVPESEQAKAAAAELQAQIDAATAAQEELKNSRMIPDVRRLADGKWVVTDAENGMEVGRADTTAEAYRLAQAHSSALNERVADTTAMSARELLAEEQAGWRRDVVATTMQAADMAADQLGANASETELKLGVEMDTQRLTGRDAARAARQIELEDMAEGGDGSAVRSVWGQSVTEMHEDVRTTINRVFAGGSIMTVFHEKGHEMRRKAIASGAINRDAQVSMFRALDTVLAGKSRQGRELRFIPDGIADGDITETMLDEAFSTLLESEVIRSGRDSRSKIKVPRGVFSRNIKALAKLMDPKAHQSWGSFMKAVRHYWGLVFSRAKAIDKGLRDGSIDREQYDDFMGRMLGLNQQDGFNRDALEARNEILGDMAMEPENLDGYQIEDGDPFSLGPGYSGFRLRKDLPTFYVNSSTQVLFPDGHEIKTNQSAPDTLPDAGREIWNRISENGGYASVSGESEWLATALAASPTPRKSGEAKEFWQWLANGLNQAEVRQRDPLDVLDAVVDLLDLETAISEPADGSRQLHYAPITDEGVVIAVENSTGEFSFGRLPSAEEVAEAKSFHEANPKEYPAFSLGPASMADALAGEAVSRIRNPKQRREVLQRIADKMADLKRDRDQVGVAFGKGYKRKAIQDPRDRASIAREARVREALRRAELEEQAYAKHEGILSADPDVVKLKQQPVHALMADPTNPLKGRIMSKSAAIRATWFDESSHGDFDGADGVSRSVFGGTLMPDQAAQELFDNGLIKEATPDAMWAALLKESNSVAKMRDAMKAAESDLKAARATAKREATAWKKARLLEERANYSPKARLLRSMAMLDGIIASLPIAERGRIGGYTQLAKIATDEKRLEFLNERIAKADEVVEKWLIKEYGRMFDKLLKQAKPVKGKPGEKPKGKAGADVHALFAVLGKARGWSAETAESHAVGIEAEIAKGEMTPEREAHATLEANLVRMVGNWKEADAARRAAAVENATSIFEAGYAKYKLQKLFEKEDRQISRKALITDTGKIGSRAQREKRMLEDNKLKGRWKDVALGLLNFEQAIGFVFGENSAQGRRLVDMERAAAYQKEDGIQAREQAVEDLFTKLAGGRYKGEQMRWDMAQKSIEVNGESFSELEAISVTLMWRQADGQRHMIGRKDGDGKPAGPWNYDQDFVDQVEASLSAEAIAVREHLADSYAAEWATLNPVFRELNGIDLPKTPNYSPLTVKPQQAQGGQTVDPVTGSTMSGGSSTPGSLRSRGQSVAEPDFRDALQTYIAHTKQMEHWKAYAGFAAEAQALLNSRDVGNSVSAKSGEQAVSVLRGWLDLFAQGGARDAAAHLEMNKMLSRMTGRAASVALVGRIGTLAIQSTQMGAAIVEMPTGSYLKRLGLLMSGNLGWGTALASPYIQRRINQMPPIVRQAVEGLKASKPNQVKHAAAKLGTLLGGADALFTAGTYAMVHDYQMSQAKALGMTGAEAEAYATQAAERAVDRIAQPTRAGARSLFENTATNPFARLGWNFASEARKNLALLAYAAVNKPASEKMRTLTYVWAINGIMAAVIRTAWRDMRDDDDDELFDSKHWDLKRMSLQVATEPFYGLPIIGSMIEAGVFKAAGVWTPQGNLFSSMDNAVGAVGRLDETLSGEADAEQVIKDVDAILSGIGLTNDTVAAAASFMHLVRDLFGVAENVTDD